MDKEIFTLNQYGHIEICLREVMEKNKSAEMPSQEQSMPVLRSSTDGIMAM